MIDEQLFCILQDTVHRWIFASTWHRLSAVKRLTQPTLQIRWMFQTNPYVEYIWIYIYTHTIFDRFIQVHTDSCFCRILQKDTEGARSKETESKPRILAEFIQRPSSASVGGIDMNPQIFLLARHCDTNLVQEGSSLGAVCGTSESVCWSFNKMIPLSSVAQSNQVSRMMNPECPWHFSWMSFAKSLKAAISSVPECRNFSGSRWFKSVPAWNCPRTCLHCLCFMDLYGALLVLHGFAVISVQYRIITYNYIWIHQIHSNPQLLL